MSSAPRPLALIAALVLSLLPTPGCDSSKSTPPTSQPAESRSPATGTYDAVDLAGFPGSDEAQAILDAWLTLEFPENMNRAPAFGKKLAAIGPQAVPNVAEFLGAGGHWRDKVVQAFVKELGAPAAPPLQALLTADNVNKKVRYAACEMAGMLGPDGEPLTPALLELAMQRGAYTQSGALHALIRIGRPAAPICDVALRLATNRRLSRSGHVREAAINLLAIVGHAGDPKQLAESLAPLLADRIYNEEAARAIAKLVPPPKIVVPPLLAMAREELEQKYCHADVAFDALAAYGPKAGDAHATLVEMWGNHKSVSLLRALIATGTPEQSRDLLLTAAEMDLSGVRRLPEEVSRQLVGGDLDDPQIRAAIGTLLRSERQGQHRATAEALAERIPASPAARAIALEILADAEYAHARIIRLLVPPFAKAEPEARLDALPTLLDLRMRCVSGSPLERARGELRRVFNAIGAPAAKPLLARLAKEDPNTSPLSLYDDLRYLPADDSVFLEALGSEDPAMRMTVVRLFRSRVIPPAAGKLLADMLETELPKEDLDALLASLARLGPPAAPAVPKLLELALQRNFRLCTDVQTALVAIGEPAWPALKRLIRDEADLHNSEWVAAAIARAGPGGIEELATFYEQTPEKRRRNVLRGLTSGLRRQSGRMKNHPKKYETALRTTLALIQSLHTGEQSFERSAAAELAEQAPLLGDDLVPVIRPLLHDSSRNVRMHAAEAAKALGKTAAPLVEDLRPLLAEEHDEIVRRYATQALSAIGPEARPAVPDLIGLLSDPKRRVAVSAAYALGSIGPAAARASTPLRTMLQSDRDDERVAAMDALCSIGCREAIPEILAFFETQEEYVCRQVARTLVRYDPLPAQAPAYIGCHLRKRIEAGDDVYMGLNEYTRALSKLGPAGATELVATFEGMPWNAKRTTIGQVIASMGATALPAVEKARASASEDMAAALKLLAEGIRRKLDQQQAKTGKPD